MVCSSWVMRSASFKSIPCSSTDQETARNMFRKTLALRVDPANAVAVSFYRTQGFTTVATVVSKKSGKLRLLMSREL